MKKSLFRIGSVAILLLLLGRPQLALSGAGNGLLLWANIVLPTLLPFMICSNVIVALDAIHLLTRPFRFLFHGILKLSETGSYVFLSGLLCGYPMGAKTCSEFMDSGKISQKEGQYLLAISNHPSPMFLLGYVVSQIGNDIRPSLLLAAFYLPIFPVAFLARTYYHLRDVVEFPYSSKQPQLSFDENLMNSCDIMVKIGGYIMLFSVLAAYITALPLPFIKWKACILGIIEITTGIQAIAVSLADPEKIPCIIAVTTFGGLSGIFQTKSVIKNAGLSIRHYITWKTVHATISCILFMLLSGILPVH